MSTFFNVYMDFFYFGLRQQHPIEHRDAKLIIEYRLVNREYRQCLVFFLSISSGSDLNHLSILRHHRFSTNIVSICTIKSMDMMLSQRMK